MSIRNIRASILAAITVIGHKAEEAADVLYEKRMSHVEELLEAAVNYGTVPERIHDGEDPAGVPFEELFDEHRRYYSYENDSPHPASVAGVKSTAMFLLHVAGNLIAAQQKRIEELSAVAFSEQREANRAHGLAAAAKMERDAAQSQLVRMHNAGIDTGMAWTAGGIFGVRKAHPSGLHVNPLRTLIAEAAVTRGLIDAASTAAGVLTTIGFTNPEAVKSAARHMGSTLFFPATKEDNNDEKRSWRQIATSEPFIRASFLLHQAIGSDHDPSLASARKLIEAERWFEEDEEQRAIGFPALQNPLDAQLAANVLRAHLLHHVLFRGVSTRAGAASAAQRQIELVGRSFRDTEGKHDEALNGLARTLIPFCEAVCPNYAEKSGVAKAAESLRQALHTVYAMTPQYAVEVVAAAHVDHPSCSDVREMTDTVARMTPEQMANARDVVGVRSPVKVEELHEKTKATLAAAISEAGDAAPLVSQDFFPGGAVHDYRDFRKGDLVYINERDTKDSYAGIVVCQDAHTVTVATSRVRHGEELPYVQLYAIKRLDSSPELLSFVVSDDRNVVNTKLQLPTDTDLVSLLGAAWASAGLTDKGEPAEPKDLTVGEEAAPLDGPRMYGTETMDDGTVTYWIKNRGRTVPVSTLLVLCGKADSVEHAQSLIAERRVRANGTVIAYDKWSPEVGYTYIYLLSLESVPFDRFCALVSEG